MFRFFRKKKTTAPDGGPEAPAPADVASQEAFDDDERAFAAAEALQGQAAATLGQAATDPPLAEPDLVVEALTTPTPTPTDPAPAAVSLATITPDRESWMQRLRQGLRKTSASLGGLFRDATIDDALYEDLESALLMADAGLPATQVILDDVKRRVRELRLTNAASVKQLLVESLFELLLPLEGPLDIGATDAAGQVIQPTVIMVAGVNGAGKTTSIGKLTRHLAQADCKVLLAAADTFRAAAKEQLAVWADRTQVQIVSQEGGDPAAVAFDAVAAGKARGCDVVIVDTAGRLATQVHLMDELRKIKRTVGKAMSGAPHEVILVVDGNTGQNALAQAKAFDDALDITGLIITKLDGTAKGGVLAAVALWARTRAKAHPDKRPLKVYFIGVGETLADLERFSAFEFARALLE
jgi:fused signal recognition particle receptor